MRSFWISAVLLLALVVSWGFYNHYSDEVLHGFIGEIEDTIITAVVDEEWKTADERFDKLSKEWHDYKKAAAFFFATSDINDTDYTIARAKYYIKAKDVSNASGELACLKEQLTFLHYNESLRFGNIF